MKHKRLLAGLVAGFALLIGALVPGLAVAQTITTGYQTDQDLQNGMIIRLVPKDTKKVEALKKGDIADMLGVVTASTDAPISVSDPTQHQVFVATFGRYDVLVSDENGVINPGDFITISSVEGVGMRSDGDYQLILGKALMGFGGGGDTESRVALKSTDGSTRTVNLRHIPVEISVAHNPVYSGDTIAGVPHFLSNIAHAVTNKPITAVRIYACLGVLILALTIAGGVLYSGIRTGMYAVGRNPLAKKAITRNLFTVIIMALVVVVIGLVAVYLLLKV